MNSTRSNGHTSDPGSHVIERFRPRVVVAAFVGTCAILVALLASVNVFNSGVFALSLGVPVCLLILAAVNIMKSRWRCSVLLCVLSMCILCGLLYSRVFMGVLFFGR